MNWLMVTYDGMEEGFITQSPHQAFLSSGRGQAAGEFRSFDPDVMAVTLRAAIDAAASTPDLDPHAYGAELVALFARATRKDPS